MSGLVFRLELPFRLAPTLNAYANMRGWQRAKLRTEVDGLIMRELSSWPHWSMGVRRKVTARVVKGKIKRRTVVTGGRKRKVIVIRESSRAMDEEHASADVIGGKLPLDRLVMARILRGDSRNWLRREARWVPADPGAGRVVIEVYEVDEV